jgi:hypothetical protein
LLAGNGARARNVRLVLGSHSNLKLFSGGQWKNSQLQPMYVIDPRSMLFAFTYF